jgi:putative ABC transport system ATP-binding protein
MICLKNIWVTYNRKTPLEQTVLKGLDLTLEPGQFATVIGGNGAGKSTLMNVIAGEVSPCKGSVEVDGIDRTKDSVQERAAYVSRVFQDPMIGSCTDLTVEENLALALSRGKRRGLKKALTSAMEDQFREKLLRLDMGLEDRLGEKMSMLSGGQRQAISLVMATMGSTEVLLLDEHTAALDPKIARKVLELTVSIVQEDKLTALMITHSMAQALELGSRTLLLREGVVARDFEIQARKGLKPTDLVELFE